MYLRKYSQMPSYNLCCLRKCIRPLSPMNQLVKKLILERCSLPFSKSQRPFCTPAQANSIPSSPTTIYAKLRPGLKSEVPVTQVLDEWVAEGRCVALTDLKSLVTGYSKYKNHVDALKIIEWASDQAAFKNLSWSKATQLDLITRVHGMEKAEDYFNSIPDESKNLSVYGVLLNCYVRMKSLEKAEAIMDKIKKFDIIRNINYNLMLKLYSQLGKRDKRAALLREMEDKGVDFDEFSYNILLNAHASDSDIEGMEKLLMKMEVDPLVTAGPYTYVAAAKGYQNESLSEKAVEMLKKAEYSAKSKDIRSTYQVLMNSYAAMGKKGDVYRLWNHLKKMRIFTNMCYLSVISSMLQLGDIECANEIFEEWEEKNKRFDNRIPNLLISAYCKKGNIETANSIINRMIVSGKKPDSGTWSHMAVAYCVGGQMENAVEMMKRAYFSPYPSWKPNVHTAAACVDYLKKKGDVDGADEIMTLLNKFAVVPVEWKERIDRYIYGGKKDLKFEALVGERGGR